MIRSKIYLFAKEIIAALDSAAFDIDASALCNNFAEVPWRQLGVDKLGDYKRRDL